ALDHAALARRELADDAEQDRVVAMGDARDVEYRTVAPARHEAGELAERAFLLEIIRRYLPLDDDLGSCRDFEVHGLAFHHLDRFAAYAADNGELVDAVAPRRHHVMHGVGAEIACRRHGLASRLPLRVVNGAAAIGRP